jgi:class 3 adenylate cyclase
MAGPVDARWPVAVACVAVLLRPSGLATPMSRNAVTLAIVFADISGSTRLYESLGDAMARELVAECLALMTERIHKHGGTVIKTIGDEIMCTFETAEQAVEAAMSMQEGVTEDLPGRNPNTPSTLTIRVGLHHGSAILESNDVFGDAVNVAARMAGLAKGGQIITTQSTAEQLSPNLRASTRHLDRISVKGKADEIDIFEVIWQAEDMTRMATGLLKGYVKEATLRLSYNGKEQVLDQDMDPLVLGRGKKADLVINDAMASREHARIECRRGKFILTDMSTNGTYVQSAEGPYYLRREDLVLIGDGRIALGRKLSEATDFVSFSCE